MKMIRNLALGAAAAGALTIGTAVLAQDAKKEEPKAKTETHHQRGEYHGNGMHDMRERCHAEQAKGGHEHK